MEINIKDLMAKKQLPLSQESGRKVESWQDYAATICKDFKIENRSMMLTDKNGNIRKYTTNYKAMIFRHAKNNMPYLQGKVALCREKWGDNCSGKGNYLISLFRKKKPWET